MRKVLDNLRDQHQYILQLLKEPHKTLELIEFVENIHHPLEEIALFPYLAEKNWLGQGGPRCSLHMGIRLDQDPLGKMRRHLKSFYQASRWQPESYPTPAWLTLQSPLSIPMEEHAVGHELAESLKLLLTNPTSDLYKEFFERLRSDYEELLKMHIDKEDHCLFAMCESHLD